MVYWKSMVSRLMFSTAWVVVLTGLGGFGGAIAGAVVELMLQALLNMSAPTQVLAASILTGSGWAFLWALRVAIMHRQVPVKSLL